MNRLGTRLACIAAGISMVVPSTALADFLPADSIYDWSTADASSTGVVLDTDAMPGMDNNDNWYIQDLTEGTGEDDHVRNADQPPFFTGNYYESVVDYPFTHFTCTHPSSIKRCEDDTYSRLNDENWGYSIPTLMDTITVSFLVRASLSTRRSVVGLTQCQLPECDPDGDPFLGNSEPFKFGLFPQWAGDTELGAWGIREWTQPLPILQDGVGAAKLDENITKTYRVTMITDLSPAGTIKQFDLFVDNLTDGGSETIFTDEPFNIGNHLLDPRQWNGLYLRVNETAIDDIAFSFTVFPDVTDDGFIGSGDLGPVLNNWGKGPPDDNRTEMTGDGFIGSGDLGEVLNNWGKSQGSGLAGVPEPATIALTLFALLLILAVRFRNAA